MYSPVSNNGRGESLNKRGEGGGGLTVNLNINKRGGSWCINERDGGGGERLENCSWSKVTIRYH